MSGCLTLALAPVKRSKSMPDWEAIRRYTDQGASSQIARVWVAQDKMREVSGGSLQEKIDRAYEVRPYSSENFAFWHGKDEIVLVPDGSAHMSKRDGGGSVGLRVGKAQQKGGFRSYNMRDGERRLTLALDGETYKALRQLGVDTDRTNQAMMETAVKEYLARASVKADA